MAELKHFAVIGSPVKQSLSPQIHTEFARQFGIQLSYLPFDISAEQFPLFWTSKAGRDLHGANITAPHKKIALQWVDQLTEHASRCCSVNTISKQADGRYLGDSTDGAGLITDLTRNLDYSLTDTNVLVVGAGGATWGILLSLLATDLRSLTVANRNPTALTELTSHFDDKRLQITGLDEVSKLTTIDLMINATSIGHYGEFTLQAPPLNDQALCYDLSYGQAHLSFQSWLTEVAQTDRGIRLSDGLGMLVEQAALSFNIWHQQLPVTTGLITQLRDQTEQALL